MALSSSWLASGPPAALVLGFLPMLLTTFAFRELNREMPDCGTTFVWDTRAFGPQIGWISGGWVPLIGTLIAMTTLAQVGATYLLSSLAPDVLGSGLARVVELAICVSAVSALLNCVVGTPRSTLSMASHGALPAAFARIHPQYRTPMVGTVAIGTAAAALLAVLTAASADFLGDAILSIGLLIACTTASRRWGASGCSAAL